MKRASGSTASRSPGRQKKRQSSSKSSDAPLSWPVTFGRPPRGREVGEGPAARCPGRPRDLAAQGGEHDRNRLGRRALQLEAAGGALPRQGRVEEVERLPHLGQRSLEGD